MSLATPDCADTNENIDGFQILRFVAKGGAGCVYEATEMASGSHVALKIARSDRLTSSAELEREARVLGRIAVPGIAHLVRAGYSAAGVKYLAVRWIAGHNLRECLYSGRLHCVGDAMVLCATVARTLGHLHALGVIHRDIKPLNILVPDGSSTVFDPSTAVVIDFSVCAELAVTGPGGRMPIGSIRGTPVFMAPEQLAGRSQSSRTDVYGLAATLYYILFGTPPFGGSPLMRAQLGAESISPTIGPLVLRRLTQEVDIPSHESISGNLRRILSNALRRDATKRTESALTLAAELEEELRDTQVSLPLPAVRDVMSETL